jgi:hypothetical protein
MSNQNVNPGVGTIVVSGNAPNVSQSPPVETLDQIISTQHIITFNELANACSAAVLYGVRQSKTNGLKLTLYGGMFNGSVGPVAIADTSLVLTASMTNYIYADTAGLVQKTTTLPTGWPGPILAGYRALYQLLTGADSITSGTCYVVGAGQPGPTGPQGAIGPTGDGLWLERRRIWAMVGDNYNYDTSMPKGFDATLLGSNGNRALGSTSWTESVGRHLQATGAITNTSAGAYSTFNHCTRGSASGRGGFNVELRWTIEVSETNNANMRSFFGLYDTSVGAPSASSDPSAIVNMIGVGCDSGESVLTLMHNDASGTATKTTITSDDSPTVSFSSKGIATIYELKLWCAANASSISYTLTDVVNSHSTTGSISSDLPASTAFLGWIMWINTGATATSVALGLVQAVANSRY